MLPCEEFQAKHIVYSLASQYMMCINKLQCNTLTDEYFCNLFVSIKTARVTKPHFACSINGTKLCSGIVHHSELQHYQNTVWRMNLLAKDLAKDLGLVEENGLNFMGFLHTTQQKHTRNFWKEYQRKLFDEVTKPIDFEEIKLNYDEAYRIKK